MFRTIIWLLAVTITFIVMLPVGLIIRLFESKEKYRPANGLAVWLCNHWVPAYLRLAGCDFEIQGVENVPDEPVMFAGNHQGIADVMLILFALKGPHIIIAKKEAEKVPIAHLWMTLLRTIFLDRSSLRQSLICINDAAEHIKHGHSVIVFPEGTRSRGPKMNQFKHGTFKIALKSDAMVVPFAIDGSYKVVEEQRRLVKSKVKVSILPPVKPNPGERSTDLAIRVQAEIEKELERLRANS